MLTRDPTTCYQQLPFPIAFHAHRCQSREAWRSPESRARHLTLAVEAMVRYLALIALVDYLTKGSFAAEVNALLTRRLRGKMTLGHWLELLREIVRASQDAGHAIQPDGLGPLLFVQRAGRARPSEFLKGLERLASYRNQAAHESWLDVAATVDQHYE